jgi:hypothetical protein
VTQPHDSRQPEDRLAYETPHLVHLGSLSDLTLGFAGGVQDGLNGNDESGDLP